MRRSRAIALPRSGQEVGQNKGHDLGTVDHVLDPDPFVRLMRQVQQARPIGDAVLQPPDPVDVLLVICAGRSAELRPPRAVMLGWTSNRSRSE